MDLKSIGKLTTRIYDSTLSSQTRDAFERIAKEIEQEIAERFIELPVDAEGMPIHVGDYLQLGDTHGEVVALTYCPANGKLPWEWQCDTGDWYNTAFAYHVKLRTIENVICDAVRDYALTSMSREEIAAKYAEEIRGMMA